MRAPVFSQEQERVYGKTAKQSQGHKTGDISKILLGKEQGVKLGKLSKKKVVVKVMHQGNLGSRYYKAGSWTEGYSM